MFLIVSGLNIKLKSNIKMKNNFLLFCALFFGIAFQVSAKNYYVAANGNNASSGLSPSTAWQTISKVNTSFAGIAAGDSILFRRGDTFYGAIVVGKSGTSGKPIIFSAYGTGAKPVITGFTRVSTWANISTGVYQAYMPGAKSTLNMVAVNNVPQALGRYPNATAANGGYLNYESFSGATSITDNQLTSATNWTGAEVVVRKNLWVLDRGKITSHSGTKLTFTNTNSSTYTGTAGFGYFIQNDARTLDQFGEWYFKSSTKYLQMYFGAATPSSYIIKVSTLDTLFSIVSKSYVNINNIVFEGANGTALFASTGGFINIQNCDFINAGAGAMNLKGISNLLIENCTTNNILSNAIVVSSSSVSNVTIRGCSVKNTATKAGMGLGNGNTYKGVVATVLSNLLIEYNNIDTTGYAALEFQGSNVTIKNNVINYFDFVKDDAGGIYTWASGTDASPGPTYTNRVIRDNIVMNGIGAPNGRNSPSLFVTGIYLDGRSMNVSVLNNTVFNMGKNGIHANNPNNVTIRGNTSFNNLNAMSVMRWVWGSVKNLTIKNNIFYPTTDAQRGFYYTNSAINTPIVTTLQNTLTNSLGIIDSNIYSVLKPTPFNFDIYSTSGGASVPSSALSLEGWQSFSKHDLNGKKTMKTPVSYTLTGLVGANKFANSSFSSGISGLTVFGSSALGTWDNTGKISGGSLKISFTLPVANKYILLHSSIGTVNAGKKYVFRFSTYGTTQQGTARIYIRKTNSPYTNLTPIQVSTFGTGVKNHEVLFNAPTSDAGGSFVIEIEQNSGTTYIDNIQFYEATATVYDPQSQLRFEYNATRSAKTISLGASYTAVDGKVYSSVTLQPYTSIILVKNIGTTGARAVADSTAKDTTAIISIAAKDLIVPITDSTVTIASAVSDSTTVTAVTDSASTTKITVAPAPTVTARNSNAASPAARIPENKPLQLTAYPNPSANVFNLMLQGGSNDKVTILVYSFDGKLLYQTTGNSSSRYSFGSNFIPGIYIVKVVQGNTTQTLKIAKGSN